MSGPATALSMEAKIARLQVRHRVKLPDPTPLPLAEPVDYPIVAEGFASTYDFDCARCQVAPYALSWSRDPLPPLLYRHDPKQVAGRIEALEFDDRGRLRIRAYVDHPEAKRAPAFSVGFGVLDYSIIDEDSPAGFRSVVKRAVVTECSLTPEPCNRFALVQHRSRAHPAQHDILAAVGRMRKALDDLRAAGFPPARNVDAASAKAKSTSHSRHIGAAAGMILGPVPQALLSRPKTAFSALVARLPSGGG